MVSKDVSLSINKSYRTKDYVDDVISFAYLDDISDRNEEFVDLGEIVLCPEVIDERAREIGNDFDSEMRFLLIHGLLHLLSYDHERSAEDEKIMYGLQNDLLKKYEERL